MSVALAISGLAYAYGKREVLRGISLTVMRGQCTMLLGPNGAGKTTIFSLIARLLAPQAGSISIDGTPGIVFQQPALDLDLTARQNLSYSAGLQGLSRTAAAQRIAEVAALTDLASRLDERTRALNGGHRRRVEIARALMSHPSLLLLDEPTVGLDIPTRTALVAMLHGLAETRDMAILWATHLADEIWPQDHLVILDNGRIRFDGLLADALQSTSSPDAAAVFACFTRPAAA